MASPRIIGGIVAVAVIAGAIAAFAIAWRPAICGRRSAGAAIVRSRAGQARPRPRRDRQLQRLPHRARRQRLCRRPAGADAVRHHLFLQHHARPRHRHRPLVGSRVPPRHAVRRRPRRRSISIRPFPTTTSPMCPTTTTARSMRYLMTRRPVRAPARENELAFPFNQRIAVAGWKLLFLRHGSTQPDSPRARNGIAAPIWSRGWRIAAPAIRRATRSARKRPGVVRRRRRRQLARLCDQHAVARRRCRGTPKRCSSICAQGWHPDHGVARGPMAEVVSNLSEVPESDVRAIATYMADVFGAPTPEQQAPRR